MSQKYHARTNELSAREVDGTIILLDERDWTYLHLNETGAVLWPLLEAGATQPELTAALAAAFSMPEADVRADVEAFVAELVAKDLVALAPE